MKKHNEELHQLIQQWKDQFVFEVNHSFGGIARYEPVFPMSFKIEDVRLDGARYKHRVRGAFHWCIEQDGTIDVWFSVEKRALFRCLRPHLANRKLWQSFEKLKDELTEGIRQASLAQENQGFFVRDALSLATEVADELEIALAKRIFPGNCEACPAKP
ncbi:MAG: hypothetical protein ACXABY_29295 [Candidatus Thorarchaeota archaeon]